LRAYRTSTTSISAGAVDIGATSGDYADANAFGRDRERTLVMHPTVKPVALVADAIKDCSKPTDIVFDPFAGSGTTIIAAEKTKRIARNRL
jgi:DNA modification methylase